MSKYDRLYSPGGCGEQNNSILEQHNKLRAGDDYCYQLGVTLPLVREQATVNPIAQDTGRYDETISVAFTLSH